mmetsp:Transcript_44830/g.62809  ORF Transcript_44830/g.62809 Transcript_44830/m.62809 type:complete len:311 (+) Transcript_44830:2-934(+)
MILDEKELISWIRKLTDDTNFVSPKPTASPLAASNGQNSMTLSTSMMELDQDEQEAISHKMIKSGKGLLFILFEKSSQLSSSSNASSSSSSSSHSSGSLSTSQSNFTHDVMISYNWTESKQHALAMKHLLESLSLTVWIDEQQMRGSLIEKMAEGIEGSRILLVCIGSMYQSSASCRLECEYASVLKRTIIPVKTTKNFSPSGWLGLILGSKKYYELPVDLPSTPLTEIPIIQEFLRDLHSLREEDIPNTKKRRRISNGGSLDREKRDSSGNLAKSWDVLAVKKWLIENKIEGEIVDKFEEQKIDGSGFF